MPVEAVVEQLAALGVREGDAVFVHASLRRVGPIEGGAEGLVAALDRAVGPAGATMMVLGAQDEWSWVNERPEAERGALLAGAVPFDALATPAQEDVGALAEVFRRCPGTLVTDHPEGRFGARGGMAAALLSDPPWDDYYGPGSALEKLLERGGKVLRLGADPETVTVLHYAEYLAPVEGKRRVRRYRRVKTQGGTAVRVVECLDDEHGIFDWPEDYFGVIVREYLAEGRGRRGVVGRAQSELLDAKDVVEFGVAWMTERFPPPG